MTKGNLDSKPACDGMDTNLFFRDRVPLRVKRACASCPLAAPCLERTLAQEGGANESYRFGYVAGTSPHRRYRMYLGQIPAVPQPYVRKNKKAVLRKATNKYRASLSDAAREAMRRKDAERARQRRAAARLVTTQAATPAASLG